MTLEYLLIVNIVGFAIMGLDKYYSKHDMRRIPEKTLFMVAIVGGSIGSIVGMYTFRHKTKHKSFTVGMPIILILQILIYYFFLR